MADDNQNQNQGGKNKGGGGGKVAEGLSLNASINAAQPGTFNDLRRVCATMTLNTVAFMAAALTMKMLYGLTCRVFGHNPDAAPAQPAVDLSKPGPVVGALHGLGKSGALNDPNVVNKLRSAIDQYAKPADPPAESN